jgi:phosphohistidine phosphatase SixA
LVYLVRHAHAGNKSKWQGPDQVRPLSARGRLQASGLVDQLHDYRVRRVLSSPAERCLQTVEPLAGRRGLTIEPSHALGVDATASQTLELLEQSDLEEAVLCTHGEAIGRVFDKLRAVGVDLTDPPRWPKGSTWLLGRDGATTWTGRYLEPRSTPLSHAGRC